MSFLANITIFIDAAGRAAKHSYPAPIYKFDEKTINSICSTISNSLIIIGIIIATCMIIYFGHKIWMHSILNSKNTHENKDVLTKKDIKDMVNTAINKEIDRLNNASESYRKHFDKINEFIRYAEELRRSGVMISGKIKYDIFDIDISSENVPNTPTHE